MEEKDSNNNIDSKNYLHLDKVVFYGRTFTEYQQMFDLYDLSLLKKSKILDCPAGPSSFVAEANRQGIHAVGCDPLFGNEIQSLVENAEKDIEFTLEKISLASHLYNWDFYKSIAGLRQYRKRALKIFESDFKEENNRDKHYVNARLPVLPFEDNSFDLALSANLLFYYSDLFDYSFHLYSILELLRVCSKEVRIYPIQGPYNHSCEYFDDLISALKKKNIIVKIMSVPHEFQIGVNEMLCLRNN
ncbi:MAG: class I SAM-dependent methyltransferase [Nitrososphaeraceae archaeon]